MPLTYNPHRKCRRAVETEPPSGPQAQAPGAGRRGQGQPRGRTPPPPPGPGHSTRHGGFSGACRESPDAGHAGRSGQAAAGAGGGPPVTARGTGARTHLALAESRAVVDFVAAGALAQGLPATVDTGLLEEGHRLVSVTGPLPVRRPAPATPAPLPLHWGLLRALGAQSPVPPPAPGQTEHISGCLAPAATCAPARPVSTVPGNIRFASSPNNLGSTW